jgi:hypothetical protein
MYTGIDSEGINREVVATLECSSLIKHNKKTSLAIPKTAILHIAKALAANLNPIVQRPSAEVEGDLEKMKGILPAFRHIVDLDSQFLEKKEGVTPSIIPISSGDIESTGSLDPFEVHICKLCDTELCNSFMHCNGCESLLGADFNLCIQCHRDKSFQEFHQMHPEDPNVKVAGPDCMKNHTGNVVRSCHCRKKDRKQLACKKVSECTHPSCQCHTSFTHKSRFYTNDALKQLLKGLEEAVKGSKIVYSEETHVRLKLIADREDVEALEAKRMILEMLRKGSDLVATGDREASSSVSADVDAGADADT